MSRRSFPNIEAPEIVRPATSPDRKGRNRQSQRREGRDDQCTCRLAPILNWPELERLGLNPAELLARTTAVGGSDANVILSGNAERIVRLWQEKRGEIEPEDLSGALNVMLGRWTEAFNRQWYQAQSGLPVSRSGDIAVAGEHPWRRCTLDGYVEAMGAVFEAKHVSGFSKPDEVLERYMPQLQHNMAVVNADRALLSVIFGNHKWEVYEVALDWLYQHELFEAEQRFWDCVQSGDQPVPAAVPAPPRPIGVREMCFEGNNLWAAAAADWLDHREAAKVHASAVTQLKCLVEDDVARAFGHGIEIRRSKAGALLIRETRQ
jgi:hypothetical protein